MDDRIARPGDPDLDCILHGLRLGTTPIVNTEDTGEGFTLEMLIDFDTTQATGWWIDSRTGEQVWPDTVRSLEMTFGVTFDSGHEHLAVGIMRRLRGWANDAAPITMTSAPGKWTLLSCPGHPAGSELPVPRSEPTTTKATQEDR
jgi:hypothetical protein